MIQCNDNQTCLILTSYIAPSIGVIVGNVLWMSSYPAIRKAFVNRKLGFINPIPYPFMLLNAFVWIVYSVLKQDHFLYFANIFGLILSLYYCTICIIAAMFEHIVSKQDDLERTITRLKYLLLFIAIVFIPSVDFFLIVSIDMDTKQNICGIMGVVCLAMFYASPLSVILNVIKKKDSSCLEGNFVRAALMNSSLWFIYGLFLNDSYVYFPNVFGAFVSVIQLICIGVFPKKRNDKNDVKIIEEYEESTLEKLLSEEEKSDPVP